MRRKRGMRRIIIIRPKSMKECRRGTNRNNGLYIIAFIDRYHTPNYQQGLIV